MGQQRNLFLGYYNGSMAIYGTTLGMSSGSDKIGYYITTDTTLRANASAPFGTTLDYKLSMAETDVNLPSMDNLLSAQLIWATAPYVTPPASSAIKFKTPTMTMTIPSQYGLSGEPTWATYGADITSIIKSEGSGRYGGGGFNSSLNNAGSSAGWAIVIAYEKFDLPTRFMSINAVNGVDTTLVFSGFRTMQTGPLNGRIMVMASDGDGSSAFQVNGGNGLKDLVGPNNGPSANPSRFFSSQINHGVSEFSNVGLLDTSGTLGTLNWGGFGQSSANVRYGVDITNVSLTPALTNNYTSITIRAVGIGEGLISNVMAFQIDTQSANLDIVKSANKTEAAESTEVIYTLEIVNKGELAANGVILKDTLPTGMSFLTGSVFYDGINRPADNIITGVNVGTINPNEMHTLTFKVMVDAYYPKYTNFVRADYTFTTVTAPIGIAKQSNLVTIDGMQQPIKNLLKTVDKEFAKPGDTLTYTMVVVNTAAYNVENAVFKDTIPNGTSFVSGSILVNGTSIAGNIESGVNVGTIAGGTTVTLTFAVKVL